MEKMNERRRKLMRGCLRLLREALRLSRKYEDYSIVDRLEGAEEILSETLEILERFDFVREEDI